MFGVIEQFFEPLNLSKENPFERGQLWWTCCPFVYKTPYVTRFWARQPTEQLDIRRFNTRDESPDRHTGTSVGEFVALAKFKHRPVVILSTSGSPYVDRGWRGEEFRLVAPLRTLRNELTGEFKANPDFVWNTVRYLFSGVFYLPRDDALGVREGIIHLDLTTSLHISWLTDPCKARLGQDAMRCLDEWLRQFIFGMVGGKFASDLAAYQELVGEEPEIRSTLFG